MPWIACAWITLLVLMPTPQARGDLLIELEGVAFQAQRIMVKPPRVRLESGNGDYRLYDREMDAMVTVTAGDGVYYEEDIDALQRQRERFIRELRENRDAIEERLADAPRSERQQWSEMVARWDLDAEDGTGGGSASAGMIEALEPRDERARVGGFECAMYEVELTDRVDSMRACLAELDELGVSDADFETLHAMLGYLARLHDAVAAPGNRDMPTLPPGLIDELMERTGMMVLAAARWQDDTGTEWQIDDLWSAIIEPAQLSVDDEYRRVSPPYAR